MTLLRSRLTGAALSAALLCTAAPAAEQHVVSARELRQQVAAASQLRKERVERIEKLFENEKSRQALQKAGLDSSQVLKAVPLLSDEELAGMAQRAGQAEQDFRAGSLNNEQLTYIVIALATAVIVLILVD